MNHTDKLITKICLVLLGLAVLWVGVIFVLKPKSSLSGTESHLAEPENQAEESALDFDEVNEIVDQPEVSATQAADIQTPQPSQPIEYTPNVELLALEGAVSWDETDGDTPGYAQIFIRAESYDFELDALLGSSPSKLKARSVTRTTNPVRSGGFDSGKFYFFDIRNRSEIVSIKYLDVRVKVDGRSAKLRLPSGKLVDNYLLKLGTWEALPNNLDGAMGNAGEATDTNGFKFDSDY